jgi:hypothetical protein
MRNWRVYIIFDVRMGAKVFAKRALSTFVYPGVLVEGG